MTSHTSLRFTALFGILAFVFLPAAAQPASPANSAKKITIHDHSAPPVKPATTDAFHPSTADIVDPKTNVITIQHHCPGHNSPAGSRCTTTVSKEEFDLLVKALDPKMSPSSRQSLATEYSRLLIMAAEARARHIQRSAQTDALVKFSALQVLGAQLVREISASKPAITEAQVAKFFYDHASDYKEVVFRPLRVPAGPVPALSTAQSMRERLAKGEDLRDLARELGTNAADGTGSDARLGPMPCRSLPDGHREICALRAGEVSLPLALGQDYLIYRVESVSMPKLDDVRAEIRKTLERQQVHEAIAKVRTPLAIELDERYFGKLPDGSVAAEHGLHPPAAKTVNPGESRPPHHHH